MYICVCNAITERQVRDCVAAGAASLDDLQFELGVATCCGCCAQTAQEYLPGGACTGQRSMLDRTIHVVPSARTAANGAAPLAAVA